MGPALLLDKSGLQSLPKRTLIALGRYYHLVICPILVLEIAADLTKPRQGGPDWLKVLAGKLAEVDCFYNVDHRDLRLADLLGRPTTMDGRPVVEAESFNTSFGRSALLIEPEDQSRLLRWRFRAVLSSDEAVAKEWREMLGTVNLEVTKAMLKRNLPGLPRARSLEEVRLIVDRLLRLGDQRTLLEMCLVDAHLGEDHQKAVRLRWEQRKRPDLCTFSPYAFFCFRARMLFHVGLVNDLISTRSSNTADLLYLYYTPFCKVFSSNDALHAALAPFLLTKDQCFVQTRDLRSDLDSIEFFWETLSQDQRKMWLDRFGHWPPRNVGSFTYRFWQRTMHVPGIERGNVWRRLSPEAQAKLSCRAKEVMQQYREIQEQLQKRHKNGC